MIEDGELKNLTKFNPIQIFTQASKKNKTFDSLFYVRLIINLLETHIYLDMIFKNKV